MLKKFAIFTLSLFILSVQTHAQTHKAQQTPKDDKPSSPVAPVAPQQHDRPNLQPEHKEHVDADVRVVSSPPKDGYDIATFWANITLAALGVGGIVVAVCTLFILRRQTKAAKDGAEAALLNAQAVINAERPWLLENIARVGDSDHEWTVSMRNAGNTPANVVDGYWSLNPLSGDFKLPADYQRYLILLQNTVIVKTDSFEVTRIDTRRYHDQAISGFRNPDDGEFRLLYLHGEVEYWDTFTDRSSPIAKPHVTQWCYVYNPHAKEFTRAPCTYHDHS